MQRFSGFTTPVEQRLGESLIGVRHRSPLAKRSSSNFQDDGETIVLGSEALTQRWNLVSPTAYADELRRSVPRTSATGTMSPVATPPRPQSRHSATGRPEQICSPYFYHEALDGAITAARHAGIEMCVEPGAALAAAMQMAEAGDLDEGDEILIINTGAGNKATDALSYALE